MNRELQNVLSKALFAGKVCYLGKNSNAAEGVWELSRRAARPVAIRVVARSHGMPDTFSSSYPAADPRTNRCSYRLPVTQH